MSFSHYFVHRSHKLSRRTRRVVFDSLCKIANVRNSEAMSTKIVIERSKGAVTRAELDNAYSELRLPFSDKRPDQLGEDDLINAFHKRLEEVTHPERKKVLREAMKTITQSRKSDYMQAILETLPTEELGGDSGMQGIEMEKMDLDKACKVLEVESGMDDETIAMVYEVRVRLFVFLALSVRSADDSSRIPI